MKKTARTPGAVGKSPAVNPKAFTKKIIVSCHQFTGTESSLKLFQKAEAAILRNYNGESNPFDSSLGGKAMGIAASIHGNKFGSIEISHFNLNIMDAISKLRNSGLLLVRHGKDVIHEDHLSNLLPPVPVILKAQQKTVVAGSPDVFEIPGNVVVPPPQAAGTEAQTDWTMKKLSVVPFKPPIPVKNGETFNMEVVFLGSNSASDFAPLAGMILKFSMPSVIFNSSLKLVA